ncbi:MAG: acetyl-CoA carboxylase biotin carboxyl carrier protein [Cyanobacteria bacterium CRU_2_1]|nr:acetyl-CoA carboxylase biotin carboxyl carrier protein [Cyanobacteria bacterium RU_5_0]NJR59881.1 acetyl-CoA carboxylase biotin carboxyl carrier protein [Cyanobacteria bacterium CRU_2_1]
MELDFNELRELLAVINQTDVAEFTLKSGDFELVVRKGLSVQPPAPAPASGLDSLAPSPIAIPPTLPSSIAVAPLAPPAPPSSAPLVSDRLLDVISPMVGTFYRSPAPDEPSYVDIGDRIRSGQVVCIVEAMKLMNEVEAEVAGEIVEILVQNGQPVEYGQVLMRVNPD